MNNSFPKLIPESNDDFVQSKIARRLPQCLRCGDTFYTQEAYDAHIVPVTDGRKQFAGSSNSKTGALLTMCSHTVGTHYPWELASA